MFSKVAEDTLIQQETYRKEIEMKQDPNYKFTRKDIDEASIYKLTGSGKIPGFDQILKAVRDLRDWAINLRNILDNKSSAELVND